MRQMTFFAPGSRRCHRKNKRALTAALTQYPPIWQGDVSDKWHGETHVAGQEAQEENIDLLRDRNQYVMLKF